ncbi:MAG: mechanosensitive ion channel [Nitrospira sp.]|nr:mechanosensitive ion channel [Nitrospira sp.]
MPLTLTFWLLFCLAQLSAASAQAPSSSTDKAVRSTLETVGVKLDQPAAGAPAPDAAAADLQQKRAAAEKELNEITQPPAARKGAAGGKVDGRMAERRSLMQQLVQIYEQHLDALRNLEQMRQRVREAERQEKEWDGFPTAAPYSVLKIDELRDAARSMTLTSQGAQTRLNMTEGLTESTQRSLKVSQEKARQLSERLEEVQDPAKRETLTADRDLARVRERVEGARAGMLEAEKQQIQEEVAEARHRMALITRQLNVAEQDPAFSQQDYDKIKKRMKAEQQSLMEEMERAVVEQSTQRQAVAAGEAALAAADAKDSLSKSAVARSKAERLTQLTELIELKRLQFDNANLHVELLREMLTGLEQERYIWDVRFATAQETLSVVEEREANAKIAAAAKQIRGWKEYGLQQLSMAGNQISDVEDRLAEAPSPARAQSLTDRLRLSRHREDLYRRALQRTDSLLGLIDNKQAEFAQREQARSVFARMKEWGRASLAMLGNAWHVELFAAEDTIEVDGKTITGRRSVTVGKVVTALAILIVGYWVAGIMARFAERQAIARLQLDPNVANIIRQWALACFFLLLVIVTLMSVKIPITAFAFLGGALAIGVGFGTQNLLKNVISGLLLLLERPLRVGDVIEVDGIRGMVTTIGLRSSTIRDINGVETLIPNSNLLEKNLTNWTYSSFRKRYSLRIAVATGSDARRVKEKLRDLAGEHGQILKEPEPYVLFEDFSEQALVFVLHYWIEISPGIDAATVASDLRFMIERTFAEEKIARK